MYHKATFILDFLVFLICNTYRSKTLLSVAFKRFSSSIYLFYLFYEPCCCQVSKDLSNNFRGFSQHPRNLQVTSLSVNQSKDMAMVAWLGFTPFAVHSL